MPAHYREFPQHGLLSTAAMIRRDLGLRPDDAVDDDNMESPKKMLDEAHARLTALRDEVDESDSNDLTAEAVEFAIEPLRQACAQLRARENESDQDADEDPDRRVEGGENGRRGDYLTDGEMHRRGSSADFRGCVASHFRRS